MAGIKPTFITGATAKIRINGKTLAFCQDFRCSVQIATQTPKVLGKYEGDSVEPLGYLVSGSFSIIRYAKGIKGILGSSAVPGLAANDAGNGVGNWGTQWGGKLGDFLARNGVGNDGRANEALDPSKFSAGTTFDIQVYQKVPTVSSTGTAGVVHDLIDVLKGGTINTAESSQLGVLNIRNARITQADFALSKRGTAIEQFTFTALYLDGDSFVANSSGVY